MIISELWTDDGPTGEFVRVIEAKIVDAGENEWARVTSQEEVEQFLASHRGGPYYLRDTKIGEKVRVDPENDITTGEIGQGLA